MTARFRKIPWRPMVGVVTCYVKSGRAAAGVECFKVKACVENRRGEEYYNDECVKCANVQGEGKKKC